MLGKGGSARSPLPLSPFPLLPGLHSLRPMGPWGRCGVAPFHSVSRVPLQSCLWARRVQVPGSPHEPLLPSSPHSHPLSQMPVPW